MPYISNAFVSEALDCARRGGVDVDLVLGQAGIHAPGGGKVTAEQFGLLWLSIAGAMNDEFFGNAARPMRPGSFALMGHALRDAATVDVGLRRALRFLRVAIDEPFGTLSVKHGVAQITLHDSQKDRSAFAYRTYWVILHGLTCWLARTRIPLHDLSFSCAAPKAAPDYGDFFGALVTFNAAQGHMRYDARFLKRPAKRTEADLKRFLRAAPGRFLVRYQNEDNTATQITKRLQETARANWPEQAALAAEFGISEATLRRRLSAGGTTFRSLRAAVLEDQAKALLRGSELPVTRISECLGYAEPSAFFRAFRSWTGISPDHWRQTQKARH
ncbi:MAG: AraC family transcriptional regulator ligand-binding domain-containing protein [Pseudomonadota bacterium]